MKTINCIKLKNDGTIDLESITLVTDLVGLRIPPTAYPQNSCATFTSVGKMGPYFGTDKYTYVLHYSGNSDVINPYSFLLDVSCGCGYEDSSPGFTGVFYLTKHDPSLRPAEKIDFGSPVSYETFEKHDTTVSCSVEDVAFVAA